MNGLANSIAATILKLREDQSGAKAAFEAAVRNFEKAKENGDINQLNHNVIPTFQEIANGNGMYADPAKKYLQSTIPNAIQQLKKTFAGKAVVPPIECRGHGLQGVSGTQSDGRMRATRRNCSSGMGGKTDSVDLPDSSNKPGKLPYTLQVIVVKEAPSIGKRQRPYQAANR